MYNLSNSRFGHISKRVRHMSPKPSFIHWIKRFSHRRYCPYGTRCRRRTHHAPPLSQVPSPSASTMTSSQGQCFGNSLNFLAYLLCRCIHHSPGCVRVLSVAVYSTLSHLDYTANHSRHLHIKSMDRHNLFLHVAFILFFRIIPENFHNICSPASLRSSVTVSAHSSAR